MSKGETIDALMGSAVYCFSRNGYEGTSLRDIARDADVPLSTIHHYFGSKADLFATVGRQAWKEIDDERSLYLEKALAERSGEPPRLETIIHALAYPVARRACSELESDAASIYLLRGYHAYDRYEFKARMLEIADRSIARWIDAMACSCPLLSRDEVIWAFSFVVGAIYSWQLIDHRYDTLMGSNGRRSGEDVTRDIVAFCSRGIEAIGERRVQTEVR